MHMVCTTTVLVSYICYFYRFTKYWSIHHFVNASSSPLWGQDLNYSMIKWSHFWPSNHFLIPQGNGTWKYLNYHSDLFELASWSSLVIKKIQSTCKNACGIHLKLKKYSFLNNLWSANRNLAPQALLKHLETLRSARSGWICLLLVHGFLSPMLEFEQPLFSLVLTPSSLTQNMSESKTVQAVHLPSLVPP